MNNNEEIKLLCEKFRNLHLNYPDIVGIVSEKDLKAVCKYLFEPGAEEGYFWAVIRNGSSYSYICFIHEKIELKTLDFFIRYGNINNYHEARINDKTLGYQTCSH